MSAAAQHVVSALLDGFYEHEGFRGWVSPDGERIFISDAADHGKGADEILKERYPGWDWESNPNFQENQGGGMIVYYPAYALQFRGWVRVVGAGIYSTWALEGKAYHTIMELVLELAREDPEHPVKVDTMIGPKLHGTAEEVASGM